MCGEQKIWGDLGHFQIGSSPRVRGTGPRRTVRKSVDRFIPACAGNSTWTTHIVGHRAVHPRVCGEQAAGIGGGVAGDGSSPRVRGTASTDLCRFDRVRFIPACAGNRMVRRNGAPSTTVHPRVCGEQPIIRSSLPPSGGSSPRVRGTGDAIKNKMLVVRFIPACAGNSPSY